MTLNVYSEKEFVREFDFNDIEIGTRKFLGVENLQVSRTSKKIIFIVNEGREAEELYAYNNRAELVLEAS